MDPQNAILKWIQPAGIKAGYGHKSAILWQDTESGMKTDTWFLREDANPVFDDKIFQPENYDYLKVDDQFYFNNPGVYLIIDNSVKESFGPEELMRLEIHDYLGLDSYWIIHPHSGPRPKVLLTRMTYSEWKEHSQPIQRNASHWDIYLLMEYLGGTFKPLNWTSFPTTLIERSL